jgi:protein phosphatase
VDLLETASYTGRGDIGPEHVSLNDWGAIFGAVNTLALECAVQSNAGRRPNNEDAAYASHRVAAVADGVGGAAAGEVASRTIVNAIINLDSRRLDRSLERALRESVAWGNETIGFIADCEPQTRGMATTLTAVALSNEDRLLLANVGDSRAYLLREGGLRQLTRDDSLVQELVDKGGLDPGQAARHPQSSVVLEVLDGDPRRRPRTAALPARAADRLLLCSDGLSDVLDPGQIAAALGAGSRQDCAELLVEQALRAGSRDNVTAVVVDLVQRARPEPAWLNAS